MYFFAIKIVVTFEEIMQFWSPLRLKIYNKNHTYGRRGFSLHVWLCACSDSPQSSNWLENLEDFIFGVTNCSVVWWSRWKQFWCYSGMWRCSNFLVGAGWLMIWGFSKDFRRTFGQLSEYFWRTFWELWEDFLKTFCVLFCVLPEDFVKTFWKLSWEFLRTFLGLSEDFLTTFWRLSEDFLKTFQRLFENFLTTFIGLSENFLETFYGLFEDFHRTNLGISEDFLNLL